MSAAVKTRTLADLYQLGDKFTLDDGHGEVTVYLKKLNPVEQETCVRKASAARGRFLSRVKDKESEEYLSAADEFLSMDVDELRDWVVATEMAKTAPALEAEFAAEEEEWSKDDYLQSLYDAWADVELQKRFFVEEGEEPDPEAKRVFEELTRYERALGEVLDKQRKHLLAEFENKTPERLLDLALEATFKLQGDLTWMVEFRKMELLFGVRSEKDHGLQYFTNRQEIDALEQQTLGALIDKMADINVGVDEGKDLPETPAS